MSQSLPNTRPYEIRRFATLEGDIWPCLVRDGLPVLLPNLWIDELSISARSNTAESYLRDIAILYEWAFDKAITLEARFRNFTGFSKLEIIDISKSICKTTTKNIASKATCIRRLESLKSFVRFAFDYYIELSKLPLSEQAQAEKICAKQLKKLRDNVQKISNSSPDPKFSSDLSIAELEAIERVINPESELNPFKEDRVKIRNYCIFWLAIETFVRRSEIVLVELTDLELGQTPTVLIKRPTTTNKSKRLDGASQKTAGRVIPISLYLAQLLADYIQHTRDQFVVPQHPSTSLFLSTRDGRRLSSTTLNQITKVISGQPSIRILGKRIHPHGLRATGANILRRSVSASQKQSDIEVVEALSYIGGWVQDSPMIRRYTRTSISERLGEIVRSNIIYPEIRK
ncbi:tyrosine-type recombinase/integrase [Pseudomonas sichuanensis]|uniref:tyrosine-type recombinase/integrase n=1 Tax=Pseudomonas sichuanensis TaxID=2213015 RepID=UPI0036EE37DA